MVANTRRVQKAFPNVIIWWEERNISSISSPTFSPPVGDGMYMAMLHELGVNVSSFAADRDLMFSIN